MGQISGNGHAATGQQVGSDESNLDSGKITEKDRVASFLRDYSDVICLESQNIENEKLYAFIEQRRTRLANLTPASPAY